MAKKKGTFKKGLKFKGKLNEVADVSLSKLEDSKKDIKLTDDILDKGKFQLDEGVKKAADKLKKKKFPKKK